MKEFLKTAAAMALFFAIALGALTFTRNYNREPSVILTSTEFAGKSCDPPCWYGIQPGKSNTTEVYQTLMQLKTVQANTFREHTNQFDKLLYIDWYFQRPAEDGAGYIYFDGNRAIALRILTVNSLKLSDLFEKLGPPEKYWTEVGYGEDREYLDAHLLYPAQGYLAEVVIDIPHGADQVDIQATTPVFSVTYFAPGTFEELPGTVVLVSQPVDSFQTWSGFGAFPVIRGGDG
jgi:hypothetical protein